MATTLDSELEQNEKSQKGSSTTSKMSQDERMKKYFAAILPQNQKSAQKRVRILPTPDGSSPFKEVWYHEVQVDGKWVKLYDPGKNDNERSPLNEWRFKHNYKNEGVLDKIIPIWRAKGDITDPANGRDLIIELAKAKTPKGKEYTIIQTVMYDDPTPVHTDDETMESWVKDELTWNDVYSKKPTEYLEAIARGETPRWDSDLGKYVYGNSSSSSTTMGGGGYSDPQADADPDEDLPF